MELVAAGRSRWVWVFRIAVLAALIFCTIEWLGGWPRTAFEVGFDAELWSLTGLAYATERSIKVGVAGAVLWTVIVLIDVLVH